MLGNRLFGYRPLPLGRLVSFRVMKAKTCRAGHARLDKLWVSKQCFRGGDRAYLSWSQDRLSFARACQVYIHRKWALRRGPHLAWPIRRCIRVARKTLPVTHDSEVDVLIRSKKEYTSTYCVGMLCRRFISLERFFTTHTDFGKHPSWWDTK